VLPEDVHELAVDVLSHRLVLSFEAVADGVTAEQLVRRLLEVVPPPRITAVTGGPGLGTAGSGAPRPVGTARNGNDAARNGSDAARNGQGNGAAA
jgi:hypothetical protein